MAKEDISGHWVRDYDKFYPKEMIEFAKRRTRDLLHISKMQTASIAILIESAYLQGVCDAAEATKIKD